MSDAHEIFLARLFGGKRSRGSGNQFNEQMDGRTDRFKQRFAFAWDGKATLSKSVGVSLGMWNKAVSQAHGEIPMLALRFYESERLDRALDLVVVEASVFAEILAEANA